LTRLLLVRHGESEYNSAHRFAGHIDIGLTDTGRQQAQRLRHRLVGERIDAVYCSDLQRARLTAEAALEGRNLAVTVCPELREIDYGDVDGLPFAEIKRLHPDLAAKISGSDLDMAFPGGETFLEFVSRVDSFMEKLAGHASGDSVLVVAHGGPLRSLLCSLLSIGQASWWRFRIDNASLTIVDTYPQGAILSQLNETRYLVDAPEPAVGDSPRAQTSRPTDGG